MATKLVRNFAVSGVELASVAVSISDAQLATDAEQTTVSSELLDKGKLALNNWGTLTQAQINNITKNLLRDFMLRQGAI